MLGELRLTNDQRRRLAVKGHLLGRRRLAGVAGIVTPDTIRRWYRARVEQYYDGSKTRRPGRPSTKPDIARARHAHGEGDCDLGLYADSRAG